MPKGPDKLGKILESLDEQPDEQASASARTVVSQLPNQDEHEDRERDFTDLPKHLARKEWLKTASAVRNKNDRPLKVLTLPGRHRVDVSMFLEGGLLANKDPLDVVGFETEPGRFAIISGLEPRLLALYDARIEKVLANSDHDLYAELISHFPFDIVNLDLTSNVVAAKDGPYNEVLKAIRRCLHLQSKHTGQWGLFLTIRLADSDLDLEAQAQLQQIFQENLDEHPKFREKCHGVYNCSTAERLLARDRWEAVTQFLAKWIVHQAHSAEWEVIRSKHLKYKRSYGGGSDKESYAIHKLLFTFAKKEVKAVSIPGRAYPVAGWHIDNLVKVLGQCVGHDLDKTLGKKKAEGLNELQKEIDRLVSLSNQPES